MRHFLMVVNRYLAEVTILVIVERNGPNYTLV